MHDYTANFGASPIADVPFGLQKVSGADVGVALFAANRKQLVFGPLPIRRTVL